VASTTPTFCNHYRALNLILLEKAQILQQQGPKFRSVATGCGGNRRGGIGTEQQRVELGFEHGEPSVLGLWPPADFVYS
jgi:hypothetical protein